MKYYYKFDFMESNFDETVKSLEVLNKFCIENDITIILDKEFPPCVKINFKKYNGSFIISKDHKLISNNLFYGKKYIAINKKFRNSPYIVKRCKDCEEFKNSMCRGIFNKKFGVIKSKILACRGNKEYDAIKTDYESGNAGHSSLCDMKCIFCGKNSKKFEFTHEFINDFLSIEEILHFMHYLPEIGAQLTFFTVSCFPGEPLLHPEIKKVLKIWDFFAIEKIYLGTHGLILDEDIIRFISQLKKINFTISLHTVDKDLRKRIMGYESNTDIRDIIKLANKYGIIDEVNILPLKSCFEKNTLLSSLQFLSQFKGFFAHTMEFFESKYTGLSYNFNEIKKIISDEKIDDKIRICPDNSNLIDEILDRIDNVLSNLENKEVLIIYPRTLFFEDIVDKFLGNKFVKVIGFENSISNVTYPFRLDLGEVIKIILNLKKNFNHIIVPKEVFNVNYEDHTGKDINYLANKFDGKIYLI